MMGRSLEEMQAIERRRDELLARREQIPREEGELQQERRSLSRDLRATAEAAHEAIDAARESARSAAAAATAEVRGELAGGRPLKPGLVAQAFTAWSLSVAPDDFWASLHAVVDRDRGQGEQAFAEPRPPGRREQIGFELEALAAERQQVRRELDLLPRFAGMQHRPADGRATTTYQEAS